VIVGSDQADYDAIASSLGLSYNFKGIRYFAGGGAGNINVFPTPWPIYGPGTQVLMSVYPDLRDLLADRLDNQIRDMLASAPPGSMLTAWHEVLSLKYPQSYLTPPNVYQMHRKMNALCRGSNVSYGCLLGGGDLRYLMRYLPPKLGFYGIDIYGNLGTRHSPLFRPAHDRWVQFRDLAKAKDKPHGYPHLLIGETNCPQQALRPDWFKAIASWLHDYGPRAKGLYTFWAGDGEIGGDWDPADTATIRALREICARDAG
jgi:hypothetical protein